MRILFTLHNFLPELLYGAERICIRQMKHFIEAGHTVGLFCAGGRPVSKESLAAIGLENLQLFPSSYHKTRAQVVLSIWKPHVRARFASAVEQFRPDVVIFHHLARLSLDLPAVTRKRGIPTAYYLHDFYPVCPSYSLFTSTDEICSNPSPLSCISCLFASRYGRTLPRVVAGAFLPLFHLRRRLAQQLLTDIDLFISPSRFLLRELTLRGYTCPESVVIRNGADTPVVAAHAATHSPVRFGFLGNVTRRKGIDVLVEAFQGTPAESLTIRGFADPGEVETFRRNHPSFNAKLELFDDNVDAFFERIDVLVVPSICMDNQPRVIIEAFTHGTPVLCSRLGGMEEMVENGKGGILFNAGDSADLRKKAMHLADHPEEITKLAASIPSWPGAKEQAEAVMNALENLISGQGTKPI